MRFGGVFRACSGLSFWAVFPGWRWGIFSLPLPAGRYPFAGTGGRGHNVLQEGAYVFAVRVRQADRQVGAVVPKVSRVRAGSFLAGHSELRMFVSLGVQIRGEFRRLAFRLAFLPGLQRPVDEVQDAVFVLSGSYQGRCPACGFLLDDP